MQTVTKRNIFKNSIAHVGKITNLVQRGKGKGARVHARGSAHGRASPSPHRCSPSFVALRLLLFLGCNKIFYQKQNGITAPNMEDHQEVDHQ